MIMSVLDITDLRASVAGFLTAYDTRQLASCCWTLQRAFHLLPVARLPFTCLKPVWDIIRTHDNVSVTAGTRKIWLKSTLTYPFVPEKAQMWLEGIADLSAVDSGFVDIFHWKADKVPVYEEDSDDDFYDGVAKSMGHWSSKGYSACDNRYMKTHHVTRVNRCDKTTYTVGTNWNSLHNCVYCPESVQEMVLPLAFNAYLLRVQVERTLVGGVSWAYKQFYVVDILRETGGAWYDSGSDEDEDDEVELGPRVCCISIHTVDRTPINPVLMDDFMAAGVVPVPGQGPHELIIRFVAGPPESPPFGPTPRVDVTLAALLVVSVLKLTGERDGVHVALLPRMGSLKPCTVWTLSAEGFAEGVVFRYADSVVSLAQDLRYGYANRIVVSPEKVEMAEAEAEFWKRVRESSSSSSLPQSPSKRLRRTC